MDFVVSIYFHGLIGGNWNNSSNARCFYWNLNNSTSNRNRNIGGHLCSINLIAFTHIDKCLICGFIILKNTGPLSGPYL